MYSEEMESYCLIDLIKYEDSLGIKLPFYIHKHGKLLIELQSAHDNLNTNEWEHEFELIADDFELKFIPLEHV